MGAPMPTGLAWTFAFHSCALALAIAHLAERAPVAARDGSELTRVGNLRDNVCRRDAMIVFDTSGSMQQRDRQYQTRLETARSALRNILPEITKDRRTGLIVFGALENCSVELRLRLAHQAQSQISNQLDRLVPGAQTPIALAVEQGARELKGQGIVVVITDGEETCGGDPCAAGRQLKAQFPELTVHVIGYKLGPKSTEPALCLAEGTGGKFISVKEPEELTAALREVLVCPKISLRRLPQSVDGQPQRFCGPQTRC